MAALDVASLVQGLVDRASAQPKPAPISDDPIGVLHRLEAEDLERVNSLIIERIFSEVGVIPELARHLISSGGKRLRPLVTVACARLCGFSAKSDSPAKLAASVELMHTATLLHDDVVDGQQHRRGKSTARMIWGNQASVLVGDFLLGRAFKMMVEVGSLRALEILSHAASVIAEGEVLQLAATARDPATADQAAYLRIIESKTAELFAAAAELGAVVASASPIHTKAIRDFGYNLGIAFQIVDDALDYGGTSSTLGKDVGQDFLEGKITLPVIYAYARGGDDEKAFWTRTMHKKEQQPGDLELAIDLLQSHQALEDTLKEANRYADEAIKALDVFGNSELKAALVNVCHFSVKRDH